MSKVKVILNRKNCIGAAACVVVDPKYWKLADDGKVDLLGSKENTENGDYELELDVSQEEIDSLEKSAFSCPAQAIKIII